MVSAGPPAAAISNTRTVDVHSKEGGTNGERWPTGCSH